MTDLSLAAQEIDRAIAARIQLLGEIAPSRPIVATALRAVADQVVPYSNSEHLNDAGAERQKVRSELLAIAAELEAQ